MMDHVLFITFRHLGAPILADLVCRFTLHKMRWRSHVLISGPMKTGMGVGVLGFSNYTRGVSVSQLKTPQGNSGSGLHSGIGLRRGVYWMLGDLA